MIQKYTKKVFLALKHLKIKILKENQYKKLYFNKKQ
jgi:hypothetical protein